MNKQTILRDTIAFLQKQLEESIKEDEIPKGTPGYASNVGRGERSIARLRYFSHTKDGERHCFQDGHKEGSTNRWKYFTPMDEAILGRLIPHDGSPEYKGHPEDFVWPVYPDGAMTNRACAAKDWGWLHFSGYYLIKKGGE